MAEPDTKGAGAGAAEGAAAGAVAEPKKKGKFLLILLPLILLGGGGGAYLAFSQYPALAALVYDDTAGEEAPEPIEYGEFLEIDNLIINPSGTEGKRYLMVKIGFESDNAKTLEEVTAKEVVVRDRILRFLSSRTVEDLAAIERRDAIKDDLRTMVNEVLEKGQITRLYFTQYVLQ